MKRAIRLLIILFFILHLWTCGKTHDSSINEVPILVKKECNILFVGNSYTYYNEGVDYHLQRMLNVDVSSDSIHHDFQKIAKGSYTLEAHFNNAETLNKIKTGKWTIVVLQEQSTRPINNPALFEEFASKLNAEIQKMNAKTILYMTWARKDQPDEMKELADSYLAVGSKINAEVVPVGRVWEYMQNINPQINLYIDDNKHPTLAGTYLTACVFFYKLFGENPMNNTYAPGGMSDEEVVFIRQAVFNYLKNETSRID